MNSVELFIARRYLTARRKTRFINLIGWVSVAGIAVGVAALLIVLAVFNGFSDVVTNVLVGFDPHLRIEKPGFLSAEETASIEKSLSTLPGITGYAPMVSGKAMLVAKSFNRVVYLRGLPQKKAANVSGLKSKMLFGDMSFADSTGERGIVIGLALADRLNSLVGAEIAVISPSGFQSALSSVSTPQAVRFKVTGIYESDNRDYDINYAYVSDSAAQQLFTAGNGFTGIEIRITDFHDAENVKTQLERVLPSDVTVSTWNDLHKSLYFVMKMERWGAFILLCLIILVATFNLLGSLSMGVVEKRRDIGVLRSMGITSQGIVNIFLSEGLLIGIAGTAIGFAIGLGVIYLQKQFHLFPLDPDVYIIPAIPVKIEWPDFFAVAIASLGLSTIMAYYPARKAALTTPAESLRWE
jgi:lipoprotein-releasing system permease protein